jgi:carbonic anhydrase
MGIVEHVRPAFESFPDHIFRSDTSDLIRMAVRENVRASVKTIQAESPSIDSLMKETGLRIVGAEYALESGVVEFFEGLSPSGQSR